MNQLFTERRVSQMSLGNIYFWTATVKDWKHLFKKDKYKSLIIESLKNLVARDLIKVYSFAIMPNHVHIIWELLRLNGKEKPSSSFTKGVAHLIVKDLKQNHPLVLPYFTEPSRQRNYRIWQRDPMAILMDSIGKIEQKIDYIHDNPLGEKWNLLQTPEEYFWSSASFYLNNDNRFSFLTDYRSYFG